MSEFERVVEASCHCGDVRIRAIVRSRTVLACNCSICTKKGFLHLIIEPGDLELLTDESALGVYTFSTHTAQHYYCKRCGIGPYYVPRSHPDGYSVNLRCVDGAKLEEWEIEPFDGQNWEQNVESIR